MDAFLRNAEEILNTACEAQEYANSEYLISISRRGGIQLLSETVGWSLPALATESGAVAAYRVRRGPSQVQVEGWSAGGNCFLSRNLPKRRWSVAATSVSAYPSFAIGA